ncbi:MAG: lipopolysaccharide biosynthesis protein [Gaiellaceae bacterium]
MSTSAPPSERAAGYGRSAAIVSVGFGATGLVTFAFFALASHALSHPKYGEISLLWSVVFATTSVLYRPVEQLLSRTIADRDVRGVKGNEHLRVAAIIQLALAALFVVVALALRTPLEDHLFNGATTLYWVLVTSVPAYAASYFARGYTAGHRWFGLYVALVFLEATSRCAVALAVVIGIAHGQAAVALGILAGPLLSLSVVPWVLSRHVRATSPVPGGGEGPLPPPADVTEPPTEGAEFTLAHGTGFAVAVLVIMIAEQTFLNAGPLLVKATEGAAGAAVAGFAFNVLLIARAPLQLFQAIQTTILPHLTRLSATGETDPFRRSVIVTLRAIVLFAAAVALGMLVLGPVLMHLVFGGHYGRLGLVAVSVGMGFYLSAATLNQAALARGWTTNASARWVAAAAAFVVFLVIPMGMSKVTQVELAYLFTSALLCGLLYELYRRPT